MLLLVLPVLAWGQATLTVLQEGQFLVEESNAPGWGTPIGTGPDGAIYVAYVDQDFDTRIVRKDPLTGAWSSATLIEELTLNNPNHAQPSVAVDSAGFVHITYNMHSTPWQYKRSDSPNSVASFTFLGQFAGNVPGGSNPSQSDCTGQCATDWLTDEPGIAAIPGNQITYHHFAKDSAGKLYLSFRECLHCSAIYHERQWSAGLVTYDVATQTWSRVGPRPFATDAVRLPHLPRLTIDAQDRLHFTWLWCHHYTQADGSAACYSQHPNYPTYLTSLDGGATWRWANTTTTVTVPVGFSESEQISSPDWFTQAGAVGYFHSTTWLGVSSSGQPYVTLHPFTSDPAKGIRRGWKTFSNGAWTPANPTFIPSAPTILVVDTLGRLIAISSGMRVHVSTNGGSTWQSIEVNLPDGPVFPILDEPYFYQTGKLRVYAHKDDGVNSLLSVYTMALSGLPTTYYVATTGSDSNTGLAPYDAFATLQHAVETAACGDTIQLQPGTYFQRTIITAQCTAAAPLTIQGMRGAGGSYEAVVEGTDATSGWTVATAQCGSSCFRIANPGYVPFALTALSQRLTVLRLHDNQMGGGTCAGCVGTGFSTLARAANSTIGRSVGTVPFWDGIEALWGEEAGFTYLRFRNGEDPDTMQVRVAPGASTNGATFLLDGSAYITLRDLEIGGGRYAVHLDGASNSLITASLLRNGEKRVQVTGGSTNTIQASTLEARWVGSTAGYAATPYAPGDNHASTHPRRVANNIYNTVKFDVGNTVSGNEHLGITGDAATTILEDSTAGNVSVAVLVRASSDTQVRRNTLFQCSAECVFIVDQSSLSHTSSFYENTFYDGEHHVRIQSLQLPKTVWIYRNLFYQPVESAKHIHFSFDTSGTVTSSAVLWIYHNTFAGSGWALDIGGDLGEDDYRLPCARAVNNLIAVVGAAGTRGISSTLSLHNHFGVYASNWCGESCGGLPSAGVSGSGCTAFVGSNVTSGTAIWPQTPLPDFVLPDGHAALDTGLRLDQTFTMGGINYTALPGMTAAYYGDDLPDRGALQGGDTPPPPEPVLEQTAVSCHQVDLLEGSPEGLRVIPCAVKPGGRIRLVANVGLTGADVSTAFDFYASDSGGATYKLASTLNGHRLGIGPDTQTGEPVVTQRLALDGQTYDPCCRWRQGSEVPLACALSATGAGERTECGVTLHVDPNATPGQISTVWLRREDGTALQTETPVTLTIIQAGGNGP